jgi:hypothetical protein
MVSLACTHHRQPAADIHRDFFSTVLQTRRNRVLQLRMTEILDPADRVVAEDFRANFFGLESEGWCPTAWKRRPDP